MALSMANISEVQLFLISAISKSNQLWQKGKKIEACEYLYYAIDASKAMLIQAGLPPKKQYKLTPKCISVLQNDAQKTIYAWKDWMTPTEILEVKKRHSMFGRPPEKPINSNEEKNCCNCNIM